MIWTSDFAPYSTYSVRVETDDADMEANYDWLVINMREIEPGTFVGPGRLINILEAQGFVVKTIIPVPFCTNGEELQ